MRSWKPSQTSKCLSSENEMFASDYLESIRSNKLANFPKIILGYGFCVMEMPDNDKVVARPTRL